MEPSFGPNSVPSDDSLRSVSGSEPRPATERTRRQVSRTAAYPAAQTRARRYSVETGMEVRRTAGINGEVL